MRKYLQKKWYLAALLLLLFLLISFWWVRQWRRNIIVDVSLPTATPSPSPSPSSSPSPSPSPTPPPAKPLATVGSRLFRSSFLAKKIPAGASYVKEERIGTVRPALEAYSHPIVRINDKDLPLVKIVNRYGGRTVNWPIPQGIKTSTGEDRVLSVINFGTGFTYDFWNLEWQGDGSGLAGGMKDFALQGDALSHPANQRVNAAGWSGLAGVIIQEDFTVGGKLNPNASIDHALALYLPHQLIKQNAFIAPAQGGEAAGDNTGDIPLGVRYALPAELNVDALDVHPFTKAVARALRDYGGYVSDRNNSGQYQGKYISTLKIETGLLQKLYGKPSDQLAPTVQKEMAEIIKQHGIYRVN